MKFFQFGGEREQISFSHEDLLEIEQAIAKQELRTSGEIRVEIRQHRRPEDGADSIQELTQKEFNRLEMHKTREKTGVLIFLLFDEKKFCIYADAGIRIKVPLSEWREISARMTEGFSRKKYKQAVIDCVCAVGDVLARHFSRRTDDTNELSDEVILT